MTRRPTLFRLVTIIVVLLAGGCGERPPEQTAAPAPLTWEKWVAERTPLRESTRRVFHRRDGLPDMRRWRPEDFLPPEALQAEHVDLCSLPIEQRRALAPAIPNASGDPKHLPLLRKYAERGVVQAQAALGRYCAHSPEYDLEGISQAEALRWAQKAAASGDAFAMDTLAYCLENREMYEAASGGEATDNADFVWDQVLYWRWRAARAMRANAMMALEDAMYREIYFYPTRQQSAMHMYKWSRLAQIFGTLGRATPEVLELMGPALTIRDYQMTEPQIEQAEALVGAWLRERLQDFDQFRTIGGCPDYSWKGDKPFDYTAFNRELAQYGLSVDPTHAERWRPPTYGSGRAAAEGAN